MRRRGKSTSGENRSIWAVFSGRHQYLAIPIPIALAAALRLRSHSNVDSLVNSPTTLSSACFCLPRSSGEDTPALSRHTQQPQSGRPETLPPIGLSEIRAVHPGAVTNLGGSLAALLIGIEPRARLQQWFRPGVTPIFERFVAEVGVRLTRVRDALQSRRKLSSGCARSVLAPGWAIGIFPGLTRRRWHA